MASILRTSAAGRVALIGLLLLASLADGAPASARKQALSLYNKGTTLMNKGQPAQARSLFDRSIKLNPAYSNAYLNRGLCHVRLGKPDLALADFSRAIQRDPENYLAYNNRGLVYSDRGDHARAIAAYSRCLRIKDDYAPAYLSRGRAYYQANQDDRALPDINRAIKLEPKTWQAFNYRGLVFTRKREFGKALADLNRAERLNPKSPLPAYNRSNVYFAAGKIDEAKAEADKALAVDARYGRAYHNRGWAWALKDQYEKALADYTAALSYEPGSTQTYINRGLVYQRLRYYPQAIDDFTSAIRLDSNNAWPFYSRGLCMAARGRHTSAIADFSAALERDPTNANTLFARAVSRRALGETALAEEDMEEGRRLGPNAKGKRYSAPLVKVGKQVANLDSVAVVEHPVLHSTGWVVGRRDGNLASRGTCWLLDRKRRLAITNNHVVDGYADLFIYFPRYDKNGHVFTHTSQYVSRAGHIKAWVLATDSRRDLAVLQLARVPAGIVEVPLAEELPKPGAAVRSVGNSGASYRPIDNGILWTCKRGKVERIVPFGVGGKPPYHFETGVLDTSSGTRPGDSGGPMINAAGKLVGVVAMGGTDPSAINTGAILLTELKSFLRDRGRRVSTGRTLPGAWKCTASIGDKTIYLRFTFDADGKMLMEGDSTAKSGTYRLADGQLTMQVPGTDLSIRPKWESDDRFTGSFSDGNAVFERW